MTGYTVPEVIDSFRRPHGFLSNFAPAHIVLGSGAVAHSVEHAFQAAKCCYEDAAAEILAAPTPQDAKRLGRRAQLRTDWEAVKLPIMRDLLERKFTPGTAYSDQLLATGDSLLIEGNTWGDTYWGMVGGEGDNWLGHLLMARRAELRGRSAVMGG